MRQCPDCEAKDRVMIAGKVFCANCGTPWQPAEQKEYDQYVASLTPPPASKQAPVPQDKSQPDQSAPASTSQNSAPAPAVATPTDDSAAVAALSATSQPSTPPQSEPAAVEKTTQPIVSTPEPTPAPAPPKAPVVPINIGSPLDSQSTVTSQTAPAPAPSVPSSEPAAAPVVNAPQVASININTKSTADRLSNATDIGKSTSINKFHQPVKSSSQASIASTNPPAPPQPVPTPPAEHNEASPVAVKTTQSAISSATTTPTAEVKPADSKHLSEHVGAEISDIESKDDGVLSDTQFKELDKIKEEQPETAPPTDELDTIKASENTTTPASQPPVKQETAKVLPITPVDKEAISQPKTDTTTPSVKPTPAATPTAASTAIRSMTDVAPAPKVSTNTPLTKLAEQPTAPITQMPSASQAKPAPLASAFMPTRPATVGVAAAPASTSAANTETTTVAGLTMSKEAAMKLALDADTNKNTGEASIGKAFKPSSVALSIVGLLLIGAYIWQVNYPNLALKVAGNRAGIAINLPNYLPSDWKLSGPIQSKPGSVSYNLANDKKDHQVAVTAAKTDWDSQALADNYVATKSDSYLALQSQGLTVYVYGDNQASWINDGKWYQLEGSSSGLSQDQIIKMATSL